jgi:hypothetical protein
LNLNWEVAMRAHGLLALGLSACLAGEAWPELYAEAYCQTAYVCVGADAVEAAAGFSDEATCRTTTQAIVEADPKYLGFTEGDCDWVASEAKACLDELAQLRGESVCDGAMPYAQFVVDAVTPACAAVYSGCL